VAPASRRRFIRFRHRAKNTGGTPAPRNPHAPQSRRDLLSLGRRFRRFRCRRFRFLLASRTLRQISGGLIRASDDSDRGGLYAPSPKRWLWRVGNLKPAGTKESSVKTGTSLGGLWGRFRRARSIPFCFFFRVVPNPEPSREGGRVVAQSAARRQCFQQL
jgi:hypothetical protein